MASRAGPVAAGTDGTDFMHRETVASHYQVSALNKSRLRKCIFSHLLLALVMLLKLLPDLLDKLDIFILEIEELEVPTPLKWEYVWVLGSLASFLGLTAIKKNRIMMMQVYFGLVNAFATVPVLLAAMIHFAEFFAYCTKDATDGLTMWQGYPLSVLWYCFILAATQVHVFTLIFSYKLIVAWRGRTAAKKGQ